MATVKHECAYKERWRFRKKEPTLHDDPMRPWCPHAGFGQKFAERLGYRPGDRDPHKRKPVEMEYVGKVPEPNPEFRRDEIWQPVVRGAWRAPEAIHLKEARVCLLGLRRFCRHATARDCHLLTLTDNLSSALCFEK
eukprot:6480692-Amphidinium_carterae.1